MTRQIPPQKLLPLTDVRVLVGRAQHQANALSSRLRELGASVIEIPFIEIHASRSPELLDNAIQNLAGYEWLILTSVNGVDAFWQHLRKAGVANKKLQHLKIAAIGPSTKRAIEKRGMAVNVIPKEYVAEAVVQELRDLIKGKRVLLARAKIARDVIPEELRKLGAIVDVVEAYETVLPSNSRIRLSEVMNDPGKRPDVITFTSSSTVKNFVALLCADQSSQREISTQLKGVNLASIGPITSGTLRGLKLQVDIEAQKYDIPGLVKAIVAKISLIK